jgi:hypothetical protein
VAAPRRIGGGFKVQLNLQPTASTMTPATPHPILEKLDALRTELADLAFTLECRGRRDAADIAMEISARIAEVHQESVAAKSAAIFHYESCPE